MCLRCVESTGSCSQRIWYVEKRKRLVDIKIGIGLDKLCHRISVCTDNHENLRRTGLILQGIHIYVCPKVSKSYF